MSDSSPTTEHLVAAYVASYDNVDDAQMDFGSVHELAKSDKLGFFDVALVERADNGKLTIVKKEAATKMGTEIGLLAGLVVGVLVPPALLIGVAGAGLAGGLLGHFSRGMNRATVEALGATLTSGHAAIVLVTFKDLPFDSAQVLARATEVTVRQFDVDSRTLLADSSDDTAPGD